MQFHLRLSIPTDENINEALGSSSHFCCHYGKSKRTTFETSQPTGTRHCQIHSGSTAIIINTTVNNFVSGDYSGISCSAECPGSVLGWDFSPGQWAREDLSAPPDRTPSRETCISFAENSSSGFADKLGVSQTGRGAQADLSRQWYVLGTDI